MFRFLFADGKKTETGEARYNLRANQAFTRSFSRQ